MRRARLLAGVGALSLLAFGVAEAAPQTAGKAISTARTAPCQGCVPTPPIPANAPAPTGQDALGENGFYLESDELIDDRENQRWIAKGDVEARYQGRTIRAQEVEYRTRTGLVVARGNAVIINADGTAQFADELELDENLSAGVAIGFSTQLQQNIRIAAASAVRRSETVTDLNKAIYTPCPICTEEGSPKSPTFSLQAEQVTQDRNRRVIYYRNAVIRVKNVPVFYAPVFWHADPSAPRASGFLIPDLSISDKRGVSYEQPYYWAISPSQDLTIAPQLNAKVNPFLNAEYRKRFYSGQMEARVGYTHEEDFGSNGERFGDQTSRSYILADGEFQIDRNWRWGFTAERTSDDLLFSKYGIGDVFEDRGIYLADSQRLISQAYTQRFGPKSYVSIGAMSFQGLRPFDDDGTFPTVAPLVEARIEPEQKLAGGRVRIRGGGVVLTRDEGIDSRRASVEADWRRPMTFASGVRLEPLAYVRGDVYSVNDLGLNGEEDDNFSRGQATLGAELAYPLYRRTAAGSILLEPMVQVLASPDADDSIRAPNEDSVVFTFDETNLFDINRAPGFDRYDGGRRINIGGRATVDWSRGREASLFLGRSFRDGVDEQYTLFSGLRRGASDYIVAATATPIQGLSFRSRARLDGESGSMRRLEAGVNVTTPRVAAGIRYYFDNLNTFGVETQDLDGGGQVLVTKNWGFTFAGVRDIERGDWRRRELGLLYQDECTRLEIVYEREETFNRAIGPSESIVVRLSLATLGAAGYRDNDTR